MNRFEAEAGVRLCFTVTNWSVLGLPGVARTEGFGTFPSFSTFEGEFPVPVCSRRSNNPKTCPSFCGVGPRIFFEGVNRFRIKEGDSYGSTSHGCIEPLEGVFATCCCLETPYLPLSSRFRFRGVCPLLAGNVGGTFPESRSRILLYSLYFPAMGIVNNCFRRLSEREVMYRFRDFF